MSRLTLFRTSPVPEERATPTRVLEGAPETAFRVHATADGGRVSAGDWSATPGRWRVAYDEWEFCQIVTGHGELREDGAAPVAIGPGDAFVIAPGFAGEWVVFEAMSKRFVVLDPPA